MGIVPSKDTRLSREQDVKSLLNKEKQNG